MNAKPRQKQKGNARMTRDELLKERPNRRREKQHAITKGQQRQGCRPRQADRCGVSTLMNLTMI
jgi:hypothetical protein